MTTTAEFTATALFAETREFGVELEFKTTKSAAQIAAALTEAGIPTLWEGYNHITRAYWKIVSDASVPGGWELVSPPLPFTDASFGQIETVSRVLISLGCTVDRQCGLHVHHFANDLTANQIGKVLALYVKHESWFDGMLPASRRGTGNNYCRTLNIRGDVASSVESFAAVRTRQDLDNLLGSRYFKVNHQSLYRHGTLEFRHHSGTIEAAKIVNWVKITRAMLQAGATSRSVVMRGAPNAWQFFRAICGKALTAYIRARTAQLATAA